VRALAATIFGRATLILPSCDGPFTWIVWVLTVVSHVDAAFDVLPLCGRLPSHVANVLQLGGRRVLKGVDQFVDSRQAILPIGKWAE
jgi:hypothetical protein